MNNSSIRANGKEQSRTIAGLLLGALGTITGIERASMFSIAMGPRIATVPAAQDSGGRRS
ncbi:MAG: hypothetical protein ACHBMF_08635 [Chromatiales bacterium]